MKVLPFKVPKPEKDALIFQEDQKLILFDKFHQHQEIQVSYIAEGEGTLIVGDTINYYKRGDILVIGSNLPHVFKSEITKDKKSRMITLFFTQEAFGEHFFDLEELGELRTILTKSVNGFKVSSKSKIIENLFFELRQSSKLQRFILFLRILKLLSKSKHTLLSSFIYEKNYSDQEGKRMRDVMEYTMNNYHSEITLTDIATIASMSKNAFCKYFKKRTNKSYFRFLNELRIERACKLLISDKDYSIAEIADNSGFNNISNFNRRFKSIKFIVPSEYKKIKAF